MLQHTDLLENKVAFNNSFHVLTKEELDRCHNPLSAQPNAWAMTVAMWNSRMFNSTLNVDPATHPKICQAMTSHVPSGVLFVKRST
jgi:hypothetical protein